MRRRDPRRLLARHRRARARVQIMHVPRSDYAPDGSIGSKQAAQVSLPREELDRVWSAEYLERLAAHLLALPHPLLAGPAARGLHRGRARGRVLLRKPFVLLRFRKPEYEILPNGGVVSWPIEKGLLVAPSGRGKGYLRLTVERLPDDGAPEGEARATISSEVVNFYPLIAGWGWFSRVGRIIYNETQLRIHVVVTHAFLRSLANLDLVESSVGTLSRAVAQREHAGRRQGQLPRRDGAPRAPVRGRRREPPRVAHGGAVLRGVGAAPPHHRRVARHRPELQHPGYRGHRLLLDR